MLTQLSASNFSTGCGIGAQNAGEAAAGFLTERLHDRGEEFVFRPDQPINRPGAQPRRGGDVTDRGDLVAFPAELGSCHRTHVCALSLPSDSPSSVHVLMAASAAAKALEPFSSRSLWRPTGQTVQHDPAHDDRGLIGRAGVPDDVESDVHHGLADPVGQCRQVDVGSM